MKTDEKELLALCIEKLEIEKACTHIIILFLEIAIIKQ